MNTAFAVTTYQPRPAKENGLKSTILDLWSAHNRVPLRSELFEKPDDTARGRSEAINQRLTALLQAAGKQQLPNGLQIGQTLAVILDPERKLYFSHYAETCPYTVTSSGAGFRDNDFLGNDGLITCNAVKLLDLEKLYYRYGKLLITESGGKTLKARIGIEGDRQEIARTQKNIQVLLENPEALDSLDLLMLAWSRADCDKFLATVAHRKDMNIAESARSVIEIGKMLQTTIRCAGLKLPPEIGVDEIDFGLLEKNLLLSKGEELLRAAAPHIPPENRPIWRIKEGTLLGNYPEGKGLETLLSSLELSLTLAGDSTSYSISLPLRVNELQAFFRNAGLKADEWIGLGTERRTTDGRPAVLVEALEKFWPLMAKLILDYQIEPESRSKISEAYKKVQAMVGYLDLVSGLATKAIMRLSQEPDINICTPEVKAHKTEIPFPIIAIEASAPFLMENMQAETPNYNVIDQSRPTAVNVVGGLTGGGKTHLLQTICQNFLAANLGDLVFAETFEFDPKGRVVVPIILSQINGNGGGWNSFVSCFQKGLEVVLSLESPICLNDELPGVAAEDVFVELLYQTVLPELAKRGIYSFFATHNLQLLKRLNDEGIHGVSLGQVQIDEEGNSMHRIIPGLQNFEKYMAAAGRRASSIQRLFDGFEGSNTQSNQ